MGHRRTFRGRGVSDSQRRKRLWADLNVPADPVNDDYAATALFPAATVAAGGSVAIAGFVSSGAPALLESTILRIRGWVDVPKTTVLVSQGANIVFAFGIGLVSEDAFLAGAVPNPASGAGSDWDGWMFLRSSSQSPVDVQGTMMDVKAMRKWESGQALVFVAGLFSDIAIGAQGATFKYSARGLFLLA